MGKGHLASRRRRTSRRLEVGPAGGGKTRKLQSAGKEKVNIIDQDGYELVNRPKRLGQYVA